MFFRNFGVSETPSINFENSGLKDFNKNESKSSDLAELKMR